MTEPTIKRCPDLMRLHQRNYGITHRSMREATGKFAQFEPTESFSAHTMKWLSWMLAAAVLVAWWMA